MFKAIGSFFAVIIALCTAAETGATTLNILAKVGEDMANDLRDNASDERQLKKLEFKHKLKERQRVLQLTDADVSDVTAKA